MFGNKKKTDTIAPPQKKAAPQPAPVQQPKAEVKEQPKDSSAVSANSPNTNVVGPGITLNGDVETLGNLLVEGVIMGNVKAESMLAISSTAKVDGNVIAKSAQIGGKVTGKIEVEDILILSSTAVVKGDIISAKLVVESGAVFNGGCTMLGSESAPAKPASKPAVTPGPVSGIGLPTSPPPSKPR